MKKEWVFLIGFLSICTPIMGQQTHIKQKEIDCLNQRIDSLDRIVNGIIQIQQKSEYSQETITNRLIDLREDYTNLLTDSHETRNWLLGMVALIVGAFGVAFPFFSNRSATKKSEKAEQRTLQLHQSIEDIKKKLLSSEKSIKEVAMQVNKDRDVVQGQLEGIKSIKSRVDNIQSKIEASERNARESQKEAMINRLFAQAANEKNNNTAIDLYTKILRFGDNDAAYIYRANLYLETKQYHKAILDANKVIDLGPSNNRNIALAYYIIAAAKANLKIYNEAIQYVNKGIEILPDNADGYKLRASIYAQQNRAKDVVDDLYKAASLGRLNANDYNELAYSHYKLEKYEIALSNVTESLKRNPNFAEALDTRGCIYMELGEQYYEPALNDFNQALMLNPQLWESYENRLRLYDKMISIETNNEKIIELKQLRQIDMDIFANHELPLKNEDGNGTQG